MDLTVQVVMVGVVLAAISLGFVFGLIVTRNWRPISFLLGRAGSLLRGHPPYENWPEAIVGLDSRGTIRYLNRAAADLFGYDESNVRGQPISRLIQGAAFKHHGRMLRHASEALQSDSGIEAEGIHQSGRVFPMRCTAVGSSFILVHDRALLGDTQHRADLLNAAFDMSPTPLLILDEQRRVVAANRMCNVVFGAPIQERIHISELFPHAELQPGKRMRLQHVASGYAFTAAVDPDGRVNGNLLLFGYRNSQRRRLEDLITEMTAYSELLLLETGEDNAIREDLALIHAASKEAISVIRNLADEREA